MIDKKSFTVCYIATLAVSIFLNLICPFLKIYWYFAFSIKQIKENHQYWRFITTYLIKPTRKVNFNTFMTLVSIYIDLHNLEIKAKAKNKYSKFIMIILIQCILNILLTYLAYYSFNLKESRSLLNELSYSFSAITSYKNPNGKTFISYVPIRNKFVPIALVLVRIFVYKDINLYILKTPLIGFISGFLFCILTKKFRMKYIPPFLKKLLNEPTDEQRRAIKEQLIQYQKELSKFQKKLKKKKKKQKNNNNNMGPNPFINILENQNNNFNIYNQQQNQNGGFQNNHNLDYNNFRYQDYIGANNIDNDNEEIDYNVDNEQEQDNNEEYNNNEGDVYEDKKDNEQNEGGEEEEKNNINENGNNIDDNYENIPDEVKKENEDNIEKVKNMEEKDEKKDENQKNNHEKNE